MHTALAEPALVLVSASARAAQVLEQRKVRQTAHQIQRTACPTAWCPGRCTCTDSLDGRTFGRIVVGNKYFWGCVSADTGMPGKAREGIRT
jgi:hypothetical protein